MQISWKKYFFSLTFFECGNSRVKRDICYDPILKKEYRIYTVEIIIIISNIVISSIVIISHLDCVAGYLLFQVPPRSRGAGIWKRDCAVGNQCRYECHARERSDLNRARANLFLFPLKFKGLLIHETFHGSFLRICFN